MLRANPPGRPPSLTEDMLPYIVDATYKVIVPNQVAGLCNIPRQTFSEWMQKGNEHIKLGKDSIYAQMAGKVHHTQSKVCSEIIAKLIQCPKNYGALTWILEKCFKEDFANLPEQVQKMLDFFINELPKMQKGEFLNGFKETNKTFTGCEGEKNTEIKTDPVTFD